MQQKLIRLPEAIGKSLTREINRYISAETDVARFARRALANEDTGDLWLGFVDHPEISRVAGLALDQYLVLLPADAVRHVERTHGMDGRDQRPPEPKDYGSAAEWVASPDEVLASAERGPNGEKRIKTRKRVGREIIESVWEVRPGRRNRALVLVSMWVKR